MPGTGSGEALRDAKRELRRQVISRRSHLPPPLACVYGALAARRLVDLPEFSRARTVLCFASFRGEIPTVYLLREVLRSGRALALPLVFPAARRLELRLTLDLERLHPGRWGIPEPDLSSPPVEVSEVDLVVAPGVAFDVAGNRLGYGGGYYDYLLGRLGSPGQAREIPVFGFAYDLQVVPAVPVGPLDRPVDGLVTERTAYRFDRRLGG